MYVQKKKKQTKMKIQQSYKNKMHTQSNDTQKICNVVKHKYIYMYTIPIHHIPTYQKLEKIIQQFIQEFRYINLTVLYWRTLYINIDVQTFDYTVFSLSSSSSSSSSEKQIQYI